MKFRVSETGEENYADFDIPEELESFAHHVIAVMSGLNSSRVIDRNAFGGFAEALGKETRGMGYVGPAIEIRRLS